MDHFFVMPQHTPFSRKKMLKEKKNCQIFIQYAYGIYGIIGHGAMKYDSPYIPNQRRRYRGWRIHSPYSEVISGDITLLCHAGCTFTSSDTRRLCSDRISTTFCFYLLLYIFFNLLQVICSLQQARGSLLWWKYLMFDRFE